VIRLGVQGNADPFYDDGVGFNIEFMKLLAQQSEFRNVSLKVLAETDTYEDVPKTLLRKANGEYLVDIAIDGLTMQDGDVGGVTFTKPYVSGFGYALITSRTSSISSVASVGSKRVGVLQGDPDAMAYVKATFPEAEIVELSDALVEGQRVWINEAFKQGLVDALVYDYPFAVAEIKNTTLQFAVSKLPQSDIKYKIGVRASDSKLISQLNSAIAAVVETEEYRDLLRKYFSSNKVVAGRKKVGEDTYTVQKGDTLSAIAERVYGDRMKYSVIETRNNLPNANLISVGQVLVIPAI
jgi:ABC-type amino acid transport substrate-binding protein